MRATSLPTATPAAALALVAAILAPSAIPSTALAERWLRPVPGAVARPFAYSSAAPFVRGAHRGVDLTAAPGTAVRAACSGRVVHAGTVAGRDEVVSVRCRARRVSYLPLARVAVRAGAPVHAGEPVGTVASGHGGLHVGVRREGDPFGYVDPMTLLPEAGRPLAPLPAPPRSRPAMPRPALRTPARHAPHPAAPRPTPRPALRTPAHAPHPATPRPTPRPAAPPAAPRPLARRAPGSLAPWPVWTGLATLLAGAAVPGTVALHRRRTGHARATLAAAPR